MQIRVLRRGNFAISRVLKDNLSFIFAFIRNLMRAYPVAYPACCQGIAVYVIWGWQQQVMGIKDRELLSRPAATVLGGDFVFITRK